LEKVDVAKQGTHVCEYEFSSPDATVAKWETSAALSKQRKALAEKLAGSSENPRGN
jgi:hypothetical protein